MRFKLAPGIRHGTEQLFYHCFHHLSKVLCLSEVNCRSKLLQGSLSDKFKEDLTYHLGGEETGSSRQGTGFLVSSKLKLIYFQVHSSRLSEITLTPTYMTVAEGLTAVTTFYTLTESKGTAQELFQFYVLVWMLR